MEAAEMLWTVVLMLLFVAIIVAPLFFCLYTLAYPWLEDRKAKRRGNYNVEQKMSYIPSIIEDADDERKIAEIEIKKLNKVEEERSQRYPMGAFVALIAHEEHANDDKKTKAEGFEFESELTAPDTELNMNYFDEERGED